MAFLNILVKYGGKRAGRMDAREFYGDACVGEGENM